MIITLSLELHWPYLLTIACKEHQACHQKNQHPADLLVKECILLLQAEPSSVYPQQAQQWPAVRIETADQFQSPAQTGNINRPEQKTMHEKKYWTLMKIVFFRIQP